MQQEVSRVLNWQHIVEGEERGCYQGDVFFLFVFKYMSQWPWQENNLLKVFKTYLL